MTAVLTGLGLSAAAGWNAWAVLLLFNGLFLILPQEFPGSTAALLSSHLAVTAAAILFLLEFVADKIPIVDHVWNLLQTLLRPVVGALLTIAAVPDTSPAMRSRKPAIPSSSLNTTPESLKLSVWSKSLMIR